MASYFFGGVDPLTQDPSPTGQICHGFFQKVDYEVTINS